MLCIAAISFQMSFVFSCLQWYLNGIDTLGLFIQYHVESFTFGLDFILYLLKELKSVAAQVWGSLLPKRKGLGLIIGFGGDGEEGEE